MLGLGSFMRQKGMFKRGFLSLLKFRKAYEVRGWGWQEQISWGLRQETEVELEGGSAKVCRFRAIVAEFSGREKSVPVDLLEIAVAPQIVFDSAIHDFCRAVSLRMFGGGNFELDAEQTHQLGPKRRNKAFVSVRNYRVRKAM